MAWIMKTLKLANFQLGLSAGRGRNSLTAEPLLDLNAAAMWRGTGDCGLCFTHMDSNDGTLATSHAMNFAFDGKMIEIYPTWRENLTPSAK